MTTLTRTANLPTVAIRPSPRWARFNLRELWQFRELLFTLAGRDLKLRYKQTLLGIVWVVFQPLMASGIFAFVFGKIAGLAEKTPNYFLLVFTGMLAWNLFSNTLTKASGCLVGNAQLISKVYFPRLVLPLSAVPSTLVDFAVAVGALVVVMIIDRVAPDLRVLLLPLWIVMLLMLALGIGLCASALTVNYRDVQYVLPVMVQLLMLASPVAYEASKVPVDKLGWYYLNPLAPLVGAFRWSIMRGNAPPWGMVAYSGAVAVVGLFIGAAMFKRMERKFADVI